MGGSDDRPRSAAAQELFAAPARTDSAWDAEDSLLSWQLAAAIFAVLVLVAFGAYRMFSNKGDGGSSAGKGGETSGSGEADIRDNFAGTSTDGLGQTTTGQSWEVVSGTWGKADGHAYVAAPSTTGGGRSIALVDLKSNNGSVSARAVKLTDGWGLVFRYKGPYNYWMLVAAPKFGIYNLVKVQDGKVVSAGNSGLAKQADGTVVRVEYSGPNISIYVDNQLVKTISDPVNQNATKVGLVAQAGAKDARWGEFAAKRLPGAPAPVSGAAPSTTSGAPSTTSPPTTIGPTTTSTGGRKSAAE